MPFDSWDDVLFWNGSLIGYAAGVKAACEDKKKSDLLLEMAEVQSKLEIEEMKNAKLRELADAVKEFVEDTHCEDCPCRRDCDDNNRIFCANDFSYHAFAAMRELGVEVD